MNENLIKKIINDLKKPFESKNIKWRVGSTNKEKTKGLALPYVTTRAIQDRLDQVLGAFNWKNEFINLEGGGKLCGLSLRINDEWLTKWDGADNTNIEPTKGGISNAMKRAAVQWGIGRYLYEIPTTWCPLKAQGSIYVFVKTPVLPSWALPKGEANENTDYTQSTIEYNQSQNKCFKAFDELGVSIAQIEEYLNTEAIMIGEREIKTLQSVYKDIRIHPDKKDMYFKSLEDLQLEKNKPTLEEYLLNIKK